MALKVCPYCGQENLSFKIFCGRCGKPLDSPDGGEGSQERSSDKRRAIKKGKRSSGRKRTGLGDSRIFGLFLMISPILMTYTSIRLWGYLELKKMVAVELIYGFVIIYVIELIFLFGYLLHKRSLRLNDLDEGMRALFAFVLFLALTPLVILGLTAVLGNFPTSIAGLLALSIFLFILWLLYAGWLRAGYLPAPERPR